MKTLVLTLLTTLATLNAGDVIWTTQDRITKDYISDVAFRAKTDNRVGPGWTLGTKPFGNILGGWECVPIVQMTGNITVELFNVPTVVCPKIDLNTPIKMTLQQ